LTNRAVEQPEILNRMSPLPLFFSAKLLRVIRSPPQSDRLPSLVCSTQSYNGYKANKASDAFDAIVGRPEGNMLVKTAWRFTAISTLLAAASVASWGGLALGTSGPPSFSVKVVAPLGPKA